MRVATMIGLLLWLTGSGYSDDWVAAGATFGSVTGAAAGLAIMVAYFMRDRRERKRERAVEQGAPETGATVDRAAGEGMGLEGHASAANPTAGASSERAASRTSAAIAESVSKKRVSNAALLRQLAWFALPVCLGAIVVPMLNIVDTFTIPRLLKQQGLTESVAMAQFGIYSRGLPLVQLVSMLFSSVSVALVPAFSEAKTLGQHALLRKRAELILRMTWLIGLAASVGLALTALPVNVMLYTDRSGTTTINVARVHCGLSSAINIMTASMLQGLGRVRTPALNLLAAVAVKSVFNAVWVPVWGVNGAAAAAVVAFSIAALLNVISLARAATFRPRWTNYMFRPLLPLGAMVLYLLLIAHGLEALLTDAFGSLSRASYTALGLISVVGGGLIYIFTLFRFGGIAKEELRTFSPIGT